MIEVFVVVYKPEVPVLGDLLAALAAAQRDGAVPLVVRLWHNDGAPPQTGALFELCEQIRSQGLALESAGGEGNLGFGMGVNRLLRDCNAPYVLVLNQDAIPEPGAIIMFPKDIRGEK